MAYMQVGVYMCICVYGHTSLIKFKKDVTDSQFYRTTVAQLSLELIEFSSIGEIDTDDDVEEF